MRSECDEVQDRLADYWDWPEEASERLEVDDHLTHCAVCAEQFRLWEESFALIREIPDAYEPEEETIAAAEMNRNVMNRIYAEEDWLLPASRRTYAFTGAFRIRVASMLTALLAVFGCGFLYTLYDRSSGEGAAMTGVMETANALTDRSGSQLFVDVPVASLSDPIVLHVSPVMPEYWIALSLLGVIMTLLILNWFSRVRA
ncbi:anti-sigma factor family protein [Cohnella nanjingensis]|uniref:Zf-HC2 domain-containing protein n=1 Tax=Cohnella nanjingensis TaxID=1387779 RepID=A0A7X0VHG7_9BACL|nr:hypothetical protein [Cohnella nanjingensis]MBB6674125.1 hypothetical protein [Cohnella nanjingensis]